MSRIRIFTGHFGSGKTEIAINYALSLAEEGRNTAIVDIDIVNPYFCTRDVRQKLEDKGIKVISSNPEYANAELMVVPAEVISAFNDKSHEVVIDVGGDGQGAAVLGQYNKFLQEEPYDMYFVVNNNRPLTQDLQETAQFIRSVEAASRLKINHLISNTNMSYETRIEDILKGDKIVSELAEKLQIMYTYTVCRRDLTEEVKGKVKGEIFPVDIYMKPPWR